MIEIIAVILGLSFIVAIHELGHLIVAKIFKVEIEKYSIGFGPKLLAFKKGKTEYRISLIPLGGYLKMKGENPDEQNIDSECSFNTKKWWERALIAFAGPFANLILAILLFIFSFMIGRSYEDELPIIGNINSEIFSEFQVDDKIISVNDIEVKGWSDIFQHLEKDDVNYFQVKRDGNTIKFSVENIDINELATNLLPKSSAIVGEVFPGLPAYQAGLLKGDLILEIDDKKVTDWYDLKKMINESKNDAIEVVIERDSQIFEKQIKLRDNPLENDRVIGISKKLPLKVKETYSFSESVNYGIATTMNIIVMNYVGLSKVITKPKDMKDNLGGPVMLVTMSKQTINKGWDTALIFFGSISLILMIMNLLPIPILDGGHIFFCFIEGIFRKPLSVNTQAVLQRLGFSFLIVLMIFTFYNDFARVIKRQIALQEQPQIQQEKNETTN
ncbi:MAG: RIP metalloprotease RseP [Candidatus Cloacimonetes bacterium]|nr:RIP metalloprotease RseP [Candidatus Cloacimonadota bacterium]